MKRILLLAIPVILFALGCCCSEIKELSTCSATKDAKVCKGVMYTDTFGICHDYQQRGTTLAKIAEICDTGFTVDKEEHGLMYFTCQTRK